MNISKCKACVFYVFALTFGLYLRADTYREPKVTVSNNYFMCDNNPKVVLKIDDDLTYIGHSHVKEEMKSKHGNDTCFRHTDSYIFITGTQSGNITKFLTIEILNFDRSNWLFFNDLPDRLDKDQVIDSGQFLLAKENFNWAILSGYCLKSYEIQYIREQSYGVNGGFIYKVFERALGFNAATKVIISYGESLSISGITDVGQWKNFALLNDEQKSFTRSFINRSNRIFFETTKDVAMSATPKPVASKQPTTSATPAISTTPAVLDLEAELKKLDDMKSKGIITDDEYKTLREALIKKAAGQ